MVVLQRRECSTSFSLSCIWWWQVLLFIRLLFMHKQEAAAATVKTLLSNLNVLDHVLWKMCKETQVGLLGAHIITNTPVRPSLISSTVTVLLPPHIGFSRTWGDFVILPFPFPSTTEVQPQHTSVSKYCMSSELLSVHFFKHLHTLFASLIATSF